MAGNKNFWWRERQNAWLQEKKSSQKIRVFGGEENRMIGRRETFWQAKRMFGGKENRMGGEVLVRQSQQCPSFHLPNKIGSKRARGQVFILNVAR